MTMSLPSVLIRKSTGEVLKFAKYPNADMQPVQGFDPDLEWLLKYTPYERPDFDTRMFILNQVDEVTTEPHPTYPNLNVYKTTYTTIKRPNEDIIRAIENAEESANREVMNYRTNEKLHMLAVGILTRKNEGVEPNASELEILEKVKQFDVDIWKNDATKRLKITQVTEGLEPDIDSDWEKGSGYVGA